MTVPTGQAQGVEADQFEDTPKGWWQRWKMEFEAAQKEHHDWQKTGQEIVDRFLDKRDGRNLQDGIDTRWNFFTANVQTQRAMLYGKTPSVDVRPRFADAPDGEARIAGEIQERILNADIERHGDGFAASLDMCLMDRLTVGVAIQRYRYVPKFRTVEGKAAITDEAGNETAPEVPEREEKYGEDVETDYVYWKDCQWSPARTWHDIRWIRFQAQLSKAEVAEKFGEDVANRIALNAQKADGSQTDAKKADPWSRANVWEIWDKENECVWFWCDGYPEVLKRVDVPGDNVNENGSQKDPLGLEGFFPCQRFMIANLTTSAYVPRADYTLCQDLYEEIDRVSTRITELERAIGAKGVYNKAEGETIGRLLSESSNNQLLPIENWSSFAERGGLAGAFQLLPLKELTESLDKLREYRTELISSLYQLSGMSDIMRGQASDVATTATEQAIKARFASVRMQALQDEFARFASEGQSIRAEIIAKHFEPQTILERSNIQHSFDAESPDQIIAAIQLIKSDASCYRVEVKAESVSMTDFSQLKAERTEVLGALSTFFQSAAPLAQAVPGSMPYLLKMLQWAMAGLRGSSEIEGVLDQAIQHATQAAQQPQMQQPQQPDPKLIANQQKAQADMAKIQATTQSELVRMNAETQQLAQRKQTDAAINVQEAAAKQRIAHGAPPMPFGPSQGGTP